MTDGKITSKHGFASKNGDKREETDIKDSGDHSKDKPNKPGKPANRTAPNKPK